MQHVGRMCDHEYCVGIREFILTREDFDPGSTKQKDKDVSPKNCTVASMCVRVHLSHYRLSLTLPIPTYYILIYRH